MHGLNESLPYDAGFEVIRAFRTREIQNYDITFSKSELIRSITKESFDKETLSLLDNVINALVAYTYVERGLLGMDVMKKSLRRRSCHVINEVLKNIADGQGTDVLREQYALNLIKAKTALLEKAGKIACNL